MKTNAIIRIVIWSVVIFVLLAVLIAGLGSNLFTLFHGSTDTVYHRTDVAAQTYRATVVTRGVRGHN